MEKQTINDFLPKNHKFCIFKFSRFLLTVLFEHVHFPFTKKCHAYEFILIYAQFLRYFIFKYCTCIGLKISLTLPKINQDSRKQFNKESNFVVLTFSSSALSLSFFTFWHRLEKFLIIPTEPPTIRYRGIRHSAGQSWK